MIPIPGWEALGPNLRRLAVSHRPDELEAASSYRAETMADLEAEFGPRQWAATIAVIAEGEPDAADNEPQDPDGDTFATIGRDMFLSVERVRQIHEGALRKLRRNPLFFELFHGRPPTWAERNSMGMRP